MAKKVGTEGWMEGKVGEGGRNKKERDKDVRLRRLPCSGGYNSRFDALGQGW